MNALTIPETGALKWIVATIVGATLALCSWSVQAQPLDPSLVPVIGNGDPLTLVIVFVLAPVVAQFSTMLYMRAKSRQEDFQALEKELQDARARIKDLESPGLSRASDPLGEPVDLHRHEEQPQEK